MKGEILTVQYKRILSMAILISMNKKSLVGLFDAPFGTFNLPDISLFEISYWETLAVKRKI